MIDFKKKQKCKHAKKDKDKASHRKHDVCDEVSFTYITIDIDELQKIQEFVSFILIHILSNNHVFIHRILTKNGTGLRILIIEFKLMLGT